MGASASGLVLGLSGLVETSFLAVLVSFFPFPEVNLFTFFSLGLEVTFGLGATFLEPTLIVLGFFFLAWGSGAESLIGMGWVSPSWEGKIGDLVFSRRRYLVHHFDGNWVWDFHVGKIHRHKIFSVKEYFKKRKCFSVLSKGTHGGSFESKKHSEINVSKSEEANVTKQLFYTCINKSSSIRIQGVHLISLQN